MVNWLRSLSSGLKKSSSRLNEGISSIFTRRRLDDETLEELEDLLICSDMGIKAAGEIISNLSQKRLDKEISEQEIKQLLADNIGQIIKPCEQTFAITPKKPAVILMVGVNGAGKTTTIGKLAKKFSHLQISFIAADTFRAAAVEQLTVWGERNNIPVHTGLPGCDAAGLCFDGLQMAVNRGDDVVFIDTAGRLQNKKDLMDELCKIVRVIKKVIPEAPHHTLLCLDATTGQNALNQVKTFKEMVHVDGLIINKLDGTAKGGILVAIAKENPTPVYYTGIGEGIDDLKEFKADSFSAGLLNLL